MSGDELFIRSGDPFALKHKLTGIRLEQPGNKFQYCTFARPRLPCDRNLLKSALGEVRFYKSKAFVALFTDIDYVEKLLQCLDIDV